MSKLYFDAVKNLEVCDLSGQKSLIQINADFKGNFVDVTTEREAKAAQDKTNAEAQAAIDVPKEKLIREKIRELAVIELKKAGKLDASGELIKGV